jgi:hypothetical protein
MESSEFENVILLWFKELCDRPHNKRKAISDIDIYDIRSLCMRLYYKSKQINSLREDYILNLERYITDLKFTIDKLRTELIIDKIIDNIPKKSKTNITHRSNVGN